MSKESTKIIQRVGGIYPTHTAKPEDCLMCNSAMLKSVLIDGICLECRDLLMTHGNFTQAEWILQNVKDGMTPREKAAELLNGCLPSPEHKCDC